MRRSVVVSSQRFGFVNQDRSSILLIGSKDYGKLTIRLKLFYFTLLTGKFLLFPVRV